LEITFEHNPDRATLGVRVDNYWLRSSVPETLEYGTVPNHVVNGCYRNGDKTKDNHRVEQYEM
jgi:hypothetical protein